jgi:hypothetical protein
MHLCSVRPSLSRGMVVMTGSACAWMVCHTTALPCPDLHIELIPASRGFVASSQQDMFQLMFQPSCRV